MSAIAGIVNFNKEPVKIEEIHSVMGALQKFPADDIQVWKNENVFFGCHAQWITPESIGEPLPFYDSERQCTITADAIIDNREELFESLQVDRDKRKTIPDSQLILLAYYKWGEESPKYLVGDFAFMIWDEREQKLFGARDFSGSRTLYYYQDQNHLAFCTIMEPLFTLPYIKKELNEEWLAEFLAVPGMNEGVDMFISSYKNINQLPPYHCITIFDGKVKVSKYSTLIPDQQLQLKTNEEYEEAFRDVLQNAVSSRLRTNHQIGAHLSGGLDSGTVSSFATRALKNEGKLLHTFSYVPPKDFVDWTPKSEIADERPYIKSTVQYVGNIKDHYYDFAEVNPLSEINDWLEIMEMPYKFFANSNWIKGIFEKAHEKEVGVLLNGGRGNLTISWGSALPYYAMLLRKMKWVLLLNELNQYSEKMGGNRLRMLPVIGKLAFPTINGILFPNESYNPPMFINPDLAKRTRIFDKIKQYGIEIGKPAFHKSIVDARKDHFNEVFPWNATGTLGTKLSLRYSLWKRDPTNDIRVIQFCLSVPEEQYVQNGMNRALIRRSTKGLLPDKVRLNQRVRGVQGADCVHRMKPYWNSFIDELEKISKDPFITEFINKPMLKGAITKMKGGPMHEYSFDPDYQLLMYSMIIYQFTRSFT